MNATKFVIYLEGGGECASNVSCTKATNSVLGSSKVRSEVGVAAHRRSSIHAPFHYLFPTCSSAVAPPRCLSPHTLPRTLLPQYFPATKSFDEGIYYASGLSSNPFKGYTRIYVPYCSQDLHSGLRTATSPATFGLYFSGHLIFRAVLDALTSSHGLGAATEVILTGGSAGGIGAWINANYLYSRVPQARVTVAPVAGMYFFAFPYTGVNHTGSELVDFREPAWPGNIALWDSYIDPSCAAGLGDRAYACMLSNYSLPYIKTAAFVTEAQTDQVQLEAHDWLPDADHQDAPERAYMAQWSANMTQALSPLTGFFNPSCYIHTAFSTAGPKIGGMSYMDAFVAWYAGGPGSHRHADSCGLVSGLRGERDALLAHARPTPSRWLGAAAFAVEPHSSL